MMNSIHPKCLNNNELEKNTSGDNNVLHNMEILENTCFSTHVQWLMPQF